MSRPRVTVIIPGSNRPEKLARAIASYHAQTLPAEQRQLLVTESPLSWPSKFSEIAIHARGEFLVYLCDDDWLEPNYLEAVLQTADRMNAKLVYTDRINHGNRPGNPDGRHPAWPELHAFHWKTTNPFLGMTFLIQQHLFWEKGCWPVHQFPMLFDWALGYQAWLQEGAAYCPETAWHYEWHGGNGSLGFNYSEQYTAFLNHFPELR